MSSRAERNERPGPYGGAARTRGILRMWDPRVWGTVIGAVGATVFVMDSRGELDNPWPVVGLLTWAVGLAAYLWAVFGANRWFAALRPVAAKAGLIYLGSVVGMLALIRVGTIVLEGQDRAGLRPALIVLAVGLHFLPFAKAFHTPMFTTLGSLMALLGVVGLVLGWAWDETAAPAVAVVTGAAMLAVLTLDALRATPERAGEPPRT